MKKLIALVVVIAAGYVVYDQFIKDKTTEEERRVEELAADFKDAQQTFGLAGAGAGLSGADTTSDAAAAVDQATRIKRELESLVPKLTEDKAKQKADTLLREVDRFLSDKR